MATSPVKLAPLEGPMHSDRTIFDAFNSSSTFTKDAEIGFGTGSRPPLSNPTCTPGPGAYGIKTTLGKVMESHITSPCQFSIRSREKFGDPNLKALSKTTANEPGPGQYDLTGRFLSGENPRKSAFPKGELPEAKAGLTPGPGSYAVQASVGGQLSSKKPNAMVISFPKTERPSLVPVGTTAVGPGEYGAGAAACEPQVDSRKPTCGSIKFGTGYKKGKNQNKIDMGEPSPGPGSYKLPGAIGGKHTLKVSLSGRNAFGSPW